MGTEGVKHLADALQNNKVNIVLSHSFILYFTFHIDTHHTSSISEWYWRWKSRTFGWCFTKQHGKAFLSLCLLFASSLFIQTLTQLDIVADRIFIDGARYLADGLRNNKVKPFVFFFICCISIDTFRHRDSLDSTLITIALEEKHLKL
jgi:hypothetical protein